MSIDDDLEGRLRRALTTPRSSDRVDVDAFLSQVHHGARVRRIKRGASVGVAGVLLVAGGGAAVGAGGLLDDSRTPVADGPSGQQTPPVTAPGTSHSKGPAQQTFATGSVTIAPKGPIAASEVTPVSLTATGTEHQWVLARTPGRDCGAPACTSIFATDDHGASWSDLGQLPAPPATSDAPRPTSVSQLRVAKRTDDSGIYDAWAYGNALWSSHDSGASWSSASSPKGQVTQLEAWGNEVYAGVSSPVPGDDTAMLYRSPTAFDDWQPVKVGPQLTSVRSIAAAKGVVGLIDGGGLHTILYVSRDGVRWERQRACPAGTDPGTLSAAADALTGPASLWVTCTGVTSGVIRFMDTDAWGRWTSVRGSFGAGVVVAARTPTDALAAGTGILGIESVTAQAPPVQVYDRPVGAPLFFGFTNDSHGYLLDSTGAILSTTQGATGWTPYAVTDTP
jgi:hypothetical protein